MRRTASVGVTLSSYAHLYERAAAIAYARAAQLTCIDPSARARSWILAHAWFASEIGTKQIHSATITVGVSFRPDDEEAGGSA